MAGQLIVSVSGISDRTLAEVDAFCAELDARDVPASLLVAPRLKGGYRLDSRRADRRVAGRRRERGDAIVLHGFDEAATKKRRGEFATLPAHEANLRLMAADRVLEHLGLRTRLFAAPGWTVSQGTVTALPRNGFRLLAGLSGITDLVRQTTVRARVLGIGEGFLSEPWWCRTLVLSAERTARREGIVRVAVAARHLRRPGPRQAMLDAVDLALMHQCVPVRVPLGPIPRADRRRLITRPLHWRPWLTLMSSWWVPVWPGLVAACELVERGRRVLIVDQENATNIGGQAFWSFGGLFFVDSPEQRRLGIRDSHELALQDWLGTAGFDRPEDHWPRQWAHAYVDFAAGEKRSWLRERGLQTFPLVGWAERGGYDARGHGNSVPRFHITWGTGPAIVDVFARRLLAQREGRAFAHRHRVDELIVENGAVVGVRGAVLEPTTAARGVASSRNTVGEFEFRAPAVIVASGGIGGNHDLVRQNWPKRMGRVPEQLLSGVPAHVDGRMIGITESAGAPCHQQRPDVALHRGHHQLRPDLAAARHPDPARAVVAVAGRHRQAAAVAVVSRLRHARHAGIHLADRDRTTPGSSSTRGSSPRSSRCPGRSRTPISPARASGTCWPGCAPARQHRCRRSSTRASTSSAQTRCATWCPR